MRPPPARRSLKAGAGLVAGVSMGRAPRPRCPPRGPTDLGWEGVGVHLEGLSGPDGPIGR